MCDRGCRLMSLTDLMADRQTGSSLEDIQNSCLKSKIINVLLLILLCKIVS